jgi:hypothetical protein
VDRRRLEAIAARVAWKPPPTDAGDTMTLLENAGPLGPDDQVIEHEGKKYVIRKPLQEPSKPGQW